MPDNYENEINSNDFENTASKSPPEESPVSAHHHTEHPIENAGRFAEPLPYSAHDYNVETYDYPDYADYNVSSAVSEYDDYSRTNTAADSVNYNVSHNVSDYNTTLNTNEEPFDSAFASTPVAPPANPGASNAANFTLVGTPAISTTPDEQTVGASQSNTHDLSPAPPARWSEPSYTVVQEPSPSMYTPGLAVHDLREAAKRRTQAAAAKRRARKARRARFVKTVCIALVCILLSGAATYGVTEFRIQRGDFDRPINQVVFGSGTGGGVASGMPEYPIPIATITPLEEMTAEDIFLMAVNQVVGIRTEIMEANFFGSRAGGTRASSVSGSGFIISTGGYILTNYHVIETAHRAGLPIIVELHDGRMYQAEIVGYDDTSDVALIKIDADNLNAASIGDSDNIRVGQSVYAIGNPFGELVFTMTDGIVSALDRVVSLDRQTINTFQFSAPVNTGNSGGPIFNTHGEVIGIVTAKVARANAEGIGFAIPINDAIDIAVDLIEHGYLTGRALIGISVRTMTRGLAEYYGVVEGARVDSVNEGSAGETAGLLVGDIITGLGGREVTSSDTLNAARRTFRADDTTSMTVWRDGEIIELSITFDEDMQAGIPR